MPQVSFSADIMPLFRAVDISHMKRFGVELDNYTYMSNPNNANSVLATLSPHDAEPPTMPPGGPLLDPGPARIIYEMAERWLPAVTYFSIECRIRLTGHRAGNDWRLRKRDPIDHNRLLLLQERPCAPATALHRSSALRVLRSFLHSITRGFKKRLHFSSPVFPASPRIPSILIEFRCGGMSLRSRVSR